MPCPRHVRRRTCPCCSIHLLSSCKKGSTHSLVKRDPEEVCPLSREIFFNPYPSDYRMAFAFSSVLYPHGHRRSLRFACRNYRRHYGLTMFHTCYRNRVAPASPPGDVFVLVLAESKRATYHPPFGPSLPASWAC
jgi:hypothetical protein